MKYYFRCPKCGNDERFFKPSERASGLGLALYFFGGVGSALMFDEHMRGRVQCPRCSHIFQRPPIPSSPLASFAGWIMALTIVPIVAAVIPFASLGLPSMLPAFPVMEHIEEAIKLEPRLAAYLLVSWPLLIVIPSWIAASVSNARFRKQFATTHQVKPLRSPEAARPANPPPEKLEGISGQA